MDNWYGIGLDTDQLHKDSERAKSLINSISEKAVSESSKIDTSFSRAFAFAGGTAAIGLLGKQILDTTAKFEKFGIVLKNTLGDVKGGAALDMIAQFAATTPFQLDEVTGSFIKLSNQGFTPTRDEMTKLGDLASSTGKGFDQLAEAVLDAQTGEFERLKEFGIKAKQSGDKVTFTFKDQKTTVDKTNSSIKDYILSLGELKGIQGSNAKISESLTGQLSNLEDKFAAMYNTIGTANKGVLYSAVGGVSTLIENYELVGKILLGLVATYGAYKAAVIVSTAATNGYTIANQIEIATLLLAEKAQLAFNSSMLANPYVAAAVAATALVAILAIYLSTTKEINQTEISKKTIQDKVSKQYDEQKSKIDMLVGVLNNEKVALSERKNALNELQKIIPNYHASLSNEGKLINNNKTAIDEYLKSLEKEIRLQAAKDELTELYKKKRLQEKTVKEKDASAVSAEAASNTTVIGESQFGGAARGIMAGQARGYADAAKKELTDTATAIKAIESELSAEISTTTAKIIAPEKNKDYWEKQKKNAQDALAVMGEAKKGTKEWNEQVKLSNQATEKLKLWDISGKASKDVNKKAQEQSDAALRETNLIAKSGLDKLQKELDNQKALDNLLEDGFAKKKALIDDDHKQELLNVEKQAQDMLEKQQESERLIWEKNGKKGVFKPTSNSASDLSEENKRILKTSSTVVEITYKSNSDKLVKELKDKYASFDEKRREIDKQYWQDEVSIKSMFSGDALNVRLNELNRQHKDAIEANDKEEADSVLKNTELFIQLFGDMSDKSVDDIRKIANESEALFDYLRTTSVNNITPKFGLSADQLISLKLGKSEMKSIEDQIKSINSNADSLETGFAKIGSGISKLFDGSKQKAAGKAKVKSGQNKIDSGIPELVSEGKSEVSIGNKDQLDGLAKEKAGIDALQESFQTVSFFAGQAQGLLNAMSTEEGDAASSAAKSIGAVMDVANSTMEGFKQGGVIGAGVAFAVSVATKIFESEKAHQAALKKLRDEKIAQQKEYNDLLMKQNELLEKATNIFGTDAYSQAIGYSKVADNLRNASKNATADLSGAKVQTGSHKTGLFGWGGEKADYSSLLKTYPALIDGQGKLNKELAQSVLDNQTLDETSKKALQSALDYTKDYEDALKSLSDYLASVFGSLGQDMMTAITDNLGYTQSALDKFADNSAKTIEKLMTDIAYSMFLADKFTKLSDDVKAVISNNSLSPQEQAAKETALLGDFYSNIGSSVEDANKFLQNSKDAASKAGFDLWNETTREATTKGFASMNQDSADELNGRFTAIQGHTFKITEGMDILKANSTQALKHLAGIETNTARLEAVESGINAVKLGIDTINMKGVKLQ